MVTKADLEARLELLQQEQLNVKAQFDAYTGAIQDVQYWLTVVEEASASSAPDEAPDNG